MNQLEDSRSSVLVEGELLKSDRKKAGYTQQSFCAVCNSVSLATVRRAEQGNRVFVPALRKMAEVLGHPLERYVRPDFIHQKAEYAISIEGDWTGFFVEADRGVHPYVVEEATVLKQLGDRVTGTTKITGSSEERQEHLEDCRVVHNALLGLHQVDDWQAPFGIGTFIVKSMRNDDWLEGFSSWFDPDTDLVETSRYILVRKSSRSFEKYCEEARKILSQDAHLYQLRKLMETGYKLKDAIQMLDHQTSE